MVRTMFISIAMGILLITAMPAAADSGYPVVLIHGFQPHQLQAQPNADQVELDGAAYWDEYWGPRAAARIDWPSHQRVTQQISTQYVWPKLQELSSSGLCRDGCLLVTHSTGDLIARHILENQRNWLENAGLEPLNFVATIDFAGAGGGSELADIAINVAEGGGLTNAAMRYAISLWLGITPTQGNLGVLSDLRVANARQLARLPDERVPRLRFVGDATDFWSVTAPFLPGHDDGVVSAHSTCGAADVSNFNSCSPTMNFSGRLTSMSNGVEQFMPYHYPIAMGSGYSHSGTIAAQHEGPLGSVQRLLNLANGETLSVAYERESGWFGRRFEYIQGSQQQTMSEVAQGLLR
ncbi:hypothetical protein CWE14_01545 [Aliidiomarina soli]|uniref:Alpha/beta hydrolase n=2 Tax=Aliidiomarina soli TaxID=1928574 RepID=A0A432WLP7_9GAMM|nr:hypothetical protein CWE14_01545 [Aliidiomarina soli]